ncbi:MAG: hypothetical protein SF172_02980 [Burkholderiales bacterium]|nr:hypothetical protein [Burkholderiales bacterium]
MKTTVEISDDLLAKAKAVAHREGATLKLLIEEGLRHAIDARKKKAVKPFRVTPFKGDGLTPEFANAGWDKIRDEIYRDRA